MDNNNQDVEPNNEDNKTGRRDFLINTAKVGAAFIGTSVALASVIDSWEKIFRVSGLAIKKLEQRTTKNILSSLIVPNAPFKLFAGGTNLIAASEGKSGLSSFLKGASEQLLSVVKTINETISENETDASSKVFRWDPNHEVFLLGGPVANKETGFLCDYNYIWVKNEKGILIQMPVFKRGEFKL